MENQQTPDQLAKLRADALTIKLREHGIAGINFTFMPGFEVQPLSIIVNDVCDFLQAYLEGRYKPLDRIDETTLEEICLADMYGATNKGELIKAQALAVRRLEMKLRPPQHTPGLELVEEVK